MSIDQFVRMELKRRGEIKLSPEDNLPSLEFEVIQKIIVDGYVDVKLDGKSGYVPIGAFVFYDGLKEYKITNVAQIPNNGDINFSDKEGTYKRVKITALNSGTIFEEIRLSQKYVNSLIKKESEKPTRKITNLIADTYSAILNFGEKVLGYNRDKAGNPP